jgi:hypothetical protein
MKREDLKGNKYGYLTVLEMVYNYKVKENSRPRTFAKCLCDCGNIVLRDPYMLKKSKYASCGCKKRKIAQLYKGKNVDNCKFNNLTILETDWDSKPIKVKCKCDCGKIVTIAKNEVTSGHTKSCGCLQSKNASKANTKDWSGVVADNGVKFIKQYKMNNKGQWIWECQCPFCYGKFNELPARVNSGHVCSCGCAIRSKREKLIEKYIKNQNYKYKTQFSFDDLKSEKGYLLRFDFAIFNESNKLSYLLEYDGEQHFRPVDIFGGEKAFKENVKRDKLKNEYCQNNNIKLIRIPYSKTNKEIKEIIDINNP